MIRASEHVRHAVVSLCGLAAVFAIAGCGGPAPAADKASQTVTVTKTVVDPAPSSRTPKAAPVPARPRALELKSASSDYFNVRVPAGWSRSSEDRGEFVRTKWTGPGGASLLIDVVPGETKAPSVKAGEVRAATAATAGYVERGFTATTLSGRDAWRWDFGVSAGRRVDYMLNECDTGYALLGSAPPARFAELRATFSKVASSLEPTCAPVPEESAPAVPADPAPSGDCDPNYSGCVPAGVGDVDCTELDETDIQVIGDDVYGLDGNDNDGIACESY
jgi:hypothetical protein